MTATTTPPAPPPKQMLLTYGPDSAPCTCAILWSMYDLPKRVPGGKGDMRYSPFYQYPITTFTPVVLVFVFSTSAPLLSIPPLVSWFLLLQGANLDSTLAAAGGEASTKGMKKCGFLQFFCYSIPPVPRKRHCRRNPHKMHKITQQGC